MQRRERFKRSGNLIRNEADRPTVEMVNVGYPDAKQVIEKHVKPLTEPRVVRGKTIGGGTSKEALRRARRRATANGVS